jgi:hypothetical protein
MDKHDPTLPCDDAVPNTSGATNSALRAALLVCARSRYTAVVIIAFAISYAFHIVEQRTDARIKQQGDLTHCVVVDTANQQRLLQNSNRVDLKAVLAACEKKVYRDDIDD